MVIQMGNSKKQSALKDVVDNGEYYLADWVKIPSFTLNTEDNKQVRIK